MIRNAIDGDVLQIVALVNSAYRGDSSKLGWTTEAELLEGIRTDAVEVAAILADDNSAILVGVHNTQIVASVHVQKSRDVALLGMFAVSPWSQGRGIGKQMLIAAERHVQMEWNLSKIAMKVISLRHELIAFYERCGYRRTGTTQEFILPVAMGRPKVANLRLEILEKKF